MVVVAVFLYLVCCVQNTAGDESIILQEVEGSDLTIRTGITGVQSDARIQWFYGPEKVKEEILISQVFMGNSGTEISSERFKGRVLLDRISGDLTINNISISDSGLYTTQITTGRLISRTFNLSVYAPVSTPAVTIINQTRNNETKTDTRTLGEFCSLLCSVRNGRDVNLTWYEDDKIISVTSNPDLSVSLNLSLEINPTNSKTFICVAANPVSKETVSINIAEICSSKPAVPVYRWIPILVSLLILLIVAGAGFWVWKENTRRLENGVQNTAEDESIILQEVEGSNLTICTGVTGVQSDARIQWFYGPEEQILISLIIKGETLTEISSERFKGRVQLDRISGDLTINNININDSGLYTTHITAERLISRTFNLSVYGVQNTAGDESIILQEVEGSDLTISTGITGVQSDARIQWFYGPEKVKEEILISQVFMGIAGTEISSERFKGRLQLDRISGDLTINNISISDSGLYTTQISAGRLISKTFNLSVYAPVSTPEVTRNYQTRQYVKETHTMILGEFCFLLCSVRNGRDVNLSLSWYEEDTIIKVTSNPDLRASLNLPLIINPANSKTFICVAENPVSKETVSITEICSSKPDVPVNRMVLIVILAALFFFFLLLLLAGVGFQICRKKNKQQESKSRSTGSWTSVTYTLVKTC
ncbi:uncharacterized protein LOC134327081 [Trichomycterus rosablanca]|uniref:uncharacterized protein LOC134327081 n=1 Tax=Trichomycterus rosablanca TaxID=2290929 RepID=UPI002F35624C